MMLLVMGGKTANNPFTLGRANVLFAGNLSHEEANVQFSSVQTCEFLLGRVSRIARRRVNCRNTEVMAHLTGCSP